MVNNIATLRIAKKLSMEELASIADTDASTISKLEKGKTKLTVEWMQRIANALDVKITDIIDPDLRVDLTHANRLVDSFDPDGDEEPSDGTHGYSRGDWHPKVKGAVPEIDIRLGAGNGTVSSEIVNLPVGDHAVSGHKVLAEWLFPESFLRHELKVSASNILVAEIIGDSMMPTYMPGDRVIVDLAQNRFVSDTVYAISDGFSEPQIKRLQRVPFSEPAKVIIISDNPALKDFEVELSKLTIIGRVATLIARR